MNWNRVDTHAIWGKYSRMDGRAAYDCSPGAIGGNGLCDSGVGAADTAVNPANFGHPLAIVRTCCWTARSAGLAYRGATGS